MKTSVLCVFLVGVAMSAAHADGGAGSTVAIDHWEMQSSAKAQQSGAVVSKNDYSTKDWFKVSGRATVMAGLIENGKYPDIFYSDNLRAVEVPDSGGNKIVVPWWYRTQFKLAKGAHTIVRSNGLIASADVWVNGQQVGDHATVSGAYPVREFDVTKWVHEGVNTLALRMYPADPNLAFSIGWVDWNPMPPDNNLGPWRGVDIVQTGPVRLNFPHVASTLALPDFEHAALMANIEASNLDNVPHDVTISGEVGGVSLKRSVHLDAGSTQTITFSPNTDAGLDVQQPKVWWPAGMGEQPLYRLQLSATVDGATSDRADAAFGIRDVSSRLTTQGQRQFFVNGKPVLIRGAGWAPDMFLRVDPKRVEAEFGYVLDLGLNTIRLEGKLEDQHFYDLADRLGIMILPGWECCDKWEAWSATGAAPWDEADMKVAAESMASEAQLLRNHPSVIGFLIGSDNAPPKALGKMYTDALQEAGWQTPVVAAASKHEATDVPTTIDEDPPIPKSAGTGVVAGAYPSGMKMDGPYDWVPPVYWYGDKLGAAYGFDAEMSAGVTIPRLEDVTRMLSPVEQEALWKYPKVRQYHSTESWSPFATLETFDTALAKRYGAPKDLADFVEKAQLENYDNVRAEFEAFNAHREASNPATGVIFWMLNNAWPSLHWHLYDYYLNPAGAYFGAKKANEPVHIQYSYDTNAVMLVNQTLTAMHGLKANVRVRDLDGGVKLEKNLNDIEILGNRVSQLTTIELPKGITGTYFVELNLQSGDGKPVSRNVYWLSTQTDKLDWAKSNWYLTPVTQYADFTALQSLPASSVEAHASVQHEGSDNVVTVTLSVPPTAKTVALFQHLSLRQSAHGDVVVPIRWSDNDITLWPGESLTLTARYAAQKSLPTLELSGWNLPAHTVALEGSASGSR